jgi:hypothetical protein
MGLMALKHRGKTATFPLSRLSRGSLAGLELRDRGDCWSFGVSFLVPFGPMSPMKVVIEYNRLFKLENPGSRCLSPLSTK